MQVAAPGAEGGLESVLLELATGLSRLGHRVILAAIQEAGASEAPLLRRAAASGAEIRRIEAPARAYPLQYRLLRQVIEEVRPLVVHTHGYHADLLGGLAARHSRTPWMVTMHGFTGGGRKNRFYEWLQVKAARRAERVIAVSAALRDRLVTGGIPPGRVSLLPNAWAPGDLLDRDEAREKLGIAGREFVIGWVGRLSPEKGADVFLRALARLAGVPWRASIIGDGPERRRLEQLARDLGVASRVTWHGLVPAAASYFAAFDCWVLSSHTEGTPIALFEAMAAEVPVVVTAVGGVPAVVSSAEALQVPAGDPDALAGAIRATMDQPGAATLRAGAARRRLLDHYAPGPWVEAHLAVYQTIVGRT